MSIVSLKKITLAGSSREKECALEKLQSLGVMHLVERHHQLDGQEIINFDNSTDTYKALKYLQSCSAKRHQVFDDNDFDIHQCIDQVLLNQRCSIDAEEQYTFIMQRIENLEPWGSFLFPKLEEIGGLRFWFYKVPVGKIKNISETVQTWQIVYRDHRFAYIIVLSKIEPSANEMPVSRIHLGSLPLFSLRQQLDALVIKIEDLRAERESLTRWIYLINKNLVDIDNKVVLIQAKRQTQDSKGVFFVQGWVPANNIELITKFVERQHLAFMAEDPGENEMPPTLLRNPRLLRGAETLVHFYQTPGYRSCDPSVVLFFSFSVFFAMILGDAGYASLLGMGLLLLWGSLGKTEQYRNMRNLFLALVITAIVWGVLIGSYFGVSPKPDSLLSSLKVFDIQDTEAMMKLSIYVGIFHLILANGCQALHCRARGDAFVALGWIAVIIGGSIVLSEGNNLEYGLNLYSTGLLILVIGLLAIFVFSSNRPIKKPVDLVLRVLEGIKGVTKITKVFGDLLSYLRLFALGLAGSSLAIIFNHNAAHALREQTGMNILTCLLIWIAGHSLNILLCLMSATVHGLRLNFIEYFSWGVSEEGYPFKAFSKQEVKE